MAVRIQVRRDSAADWTANNPTLAQGEVGHESDTNNVKIGDGVTAWTSLAYFGGTGGGHTIQDEGTPLAQRANLNFVGAGVTVTDGGAGPDSTIVTIPSAGLSAEESDQLELAYTSSMYLITR